MYVLWMYIMHIYILFVCLYICVCVCVSVIISQLPTITGGYIPFEILLIFPASNLHLVDDSSI